MTDQATAIELIPADAFTVEELTDAYNQTRVDYIVPMPMNAAKLHQYISVYDIDLSASAVATDGEDILGLCMLAFRNNRAWLTRLGIIRSKRRRGAAWTLFRHLIETARQRKAAHITLEVIKDNEPAYNLFIKSGFEPTRELLVLRRPPHAEPSFDVPAASIEAVDSAGVLELLQRRNGRPSWVDDNQSLVNAGQLHGFWATLADGSQGWLVYQNTTFQLDRVVVQTERGNPVQVAHTLLSHLHQTHPLKDTKTENLPAGDPHWPAFEKVGYLVSFRRIEMRLWFRGD